MKFEYEKDERKHRIKTFWRFHLSKYNLSGYFFDRYFVFLPFASLTINYLHAVNGKLTMG